MLNAPISPRQRDARAPRIPLTNAEVNGYYLQVARALCRRPHTHRVLAFLLDWGGPETIEELLDTTWRSHLAHDDTADAATRGSQHFDYELARAVLHALGGELALIQDDLPAT